MVLEDAHRRGLFTIADQFIAPALSEATEMTMQRERWPGWDAAKDLSDLSRVAQIEQRSWNSADCLTCASEYVRRELVSRGVEAARVAVNPYPIDASRYGVADRTDRKGVITIGFVGAVGLRKGAAYFLEVARRLASSATQFVMVGPVDLSATGQREMSTAVELTGRAARSDIATRLAEFDIFFFPSTCEGSAGCVMEAMASGLPVVTSPNSGTIIRDGIDGFVRNHDDVDGLAACLELLVRDVALRERMGRAARQAAETNNLARFGMRMLELMADRISKQTRYPSITPETASVAER
jgi:glycosyltransferase involved in cell wall biosynthesis